MLCISESLLAVNRFDLSAIESVEIAAIGRSEVGTRGFVNLTVRLTRGVRHGVSDRETSESLPSE